MSSQDAQIQLASVQKTNCIHKWCLDSNCQNNHTKEQDEYQELVVLYRKATHEYTTKLQELEPNVIRKDCTSTTISPSNSDSRVCLGMTKCTYGPNCLFGIKCKSFHDPKQIELFEVRDKMMNSEKELEHYEKHHRINCINRSGRDGYVANVKSAAYHNGSRDSSRQGSRDSSRQGSRDSSRSGSPEGRTPRENRTFDFNELEKQFKSCNVARGGSYDSRGGSNSYDSRGGSNSYDSRGGSNSYDSRGGSNGYGRGGSNGAGSGSNGYGGGGSNGAGSGSNGYRGGGSNGAGSGSNGYRGGGSNGAGSGSYRGGGSNGAGSGSYRGGGSNGAGSGSYDRGGGNTGGGSYGARSGNNSARSGNNSARGGNNDYGYGYGYGGGNGYSGGR
jgi:hypothetical protein